MNKPVFRVVGLDHATCEDAYFGDETSTEQNLVEATVTQLSIYQPSEPETVTIRLCDLLPALQRSASATYSWQFARSEGRRCFAGVKRIPDERKYRAKDRTDGKG